MGVFVLLFPDILAAGLPSFSVLLLAPYTTQLNKGSSYRFSDLTVLLMQTQELPNKNELNGLSFLTGRMRF